MILIKKSFELLYARETKDDTQIEISTHLELPPMYKVFINSFVVGRDKLRFEYFISEKSAMKLQLGDLNYNGILSGLIGLYNLFSIEESEKVNSKLYAEDEKIKELQLYPIGECISNTILMLGCGSENRDQIFLESNNLFEGNKRTLFVDANIFEFIKKLELVASETIGYGVKSYEQFYKNWGETSWRIKSQEGDTKANANPVSSKHHKQKQRPNVTIENKTSINVKLSKIPKVIFTIKSFRRNNVGFNEAYTKTISYHKQFEIVGNDHYELLFNCVCGNEINMNHNHLEQEKLISSSSSMPERLYKIGQQLGLKNMGKENDVYNFKYTFMDETAWYKTNICSSCHHKYLQCHSMIIGENRPGSHDLINFHGIYLVE